MSDARKQCSFVAHIWLEGGAMDGAEWRGRVHNVRGEQKAYFQDLHGLKSFLEQFSEVPVPVGKKEDHSKEKSWLPGN